MKTVTATQDVVIRIRRTDTDRGYKMGEKYRIIDRAGLSPTVIPTDDGGYMVCEPINGGNYVNVRVADMAPDLDSDLKMLEKREKEERAALDLTTEKIAYMKKHKLTDFDQYNFDLYRALKVVESKTGNTQAKAEALAAIFPQR